MWNVWENEDSRAYRSSGRPTNRKINGKKTENNPAGFFTGGRGGITKTGSKVYSENDDYDVKITKSIAHILRGVRPTAIDTAEKLKEGLITITDPDHIENSNLNR